MKATGKTFNIVHDWNTVPVVEYLSKGIPVYHAVLANGKQLFVTKTANMNTGDEFWTSVPEGDLKLAGSIGKLIDIILAKPQQTSMF